MRYKILRPPATVDPRFAGFASLAELYTNIPPVSEVVDEQDAVDYVRSVHPDVLAMPFECQLGSSHVQMLGMIPQDANYDRDSPIPFVLFVYAVPENNRDKRSITEKRQYHGELWKPPVLEPEVPSDVDYHRVSIRTNSVPQYPAVYAKAFRRGNKQVLFIEIGEAKMSIEFLDGTSLHNEQPD